MAGSTTGKIRTAVRGLGEIALRVTNLDAMQKFYAEVIGLPLMTRVLNCAFFKIAEGFGGHTQVLALFDRSQNPGYRGPDAATSTIDHIGWLPVYRSIGRGFLKRHTQPPGSHSRPGGHHRVSARSRPARC
jgi:catechol 2,3-dioxygenase-like lactoylglutathione lyase family enzyme